MPHSKCHAAQIKRWKRKHRKWCSDYERMRRTVKRLAEQGVELSGKALRR